MSEPQVVAKSLDERVMVKTCEDCHRSLSADRFPVYGNPKLGQSARWCEDCWSRKMRLGHPPKCRNGHPRAARATNGRRSWCWACVVERETAA